MFSKVTRSNHVKLTATCPHKQVVLPPAREPHVTLLGIAVVSYCLRNQHVKILTFGNEAGCEKPIRQKVLRSVLLR